MQLNTELLTHFVGGQLEIQNSNEDYLYRGEIESAEVVDKQIKVKFAWLGKNDGGCNKPSSEWTADNNLDYGASLQIYNVSDVDVLGRITMQSSIVGELCTFFLKRCTDSNGEERKLDRNRVKGLA